MPDGSCRTCGGELVKCSRCVECKQVIQKICRMCRFTTEREFHHECLNLERDQQGDTKYATVFVTSSKDIHHHENDDKQNNYLPKVLLVFCIIGLFVVGVVGFSYFYFMHQTTDSEQYPKLIEGNDNLTSETSGAIVLLDTNTGINYKSCLGSANGSYLLIECPTSYGFVYQAIVHIPTDLAVKFEGNVFSFRDFSVTENADSIKIDYQKKMYSTSFILR